MSHGAAAPSSPGGATGIRQPRQRDARGPAAKRPFRKIAAALLAATALVGLWRLSASAMINPNYTPAHLLRDAAMILRVAAGPLGEKGECPVRVVKTLAGQAPAKLTLQGNWKDENLQRELKEAFAGRKEAPALLFMGDFAQAAMGADEVQSKPVGLLSIGIVWFALFAERDGTYRLEMDPLNIKAVWAGGDGTLEQLLAQLLAHPGALTVPTTVGVKWGPQMPVGALEGRVHDLLAVELAPGQRPYLLALCDTGDRAYQMAPDGKSFVERTDALKLTGKSRLAACADFNADGRLDLAAWDGAALSLLLQDAQGAFSSQPVAVALGKDVLRLAALSAGPQCKAGLLVSTSGAPVVLVAADKGQFTRQELPAAPAELAKELGEVGPCIAADLDGDGQVDIFQPWTKGGVLYRGKAAGAFDPPRKVCDAQLGQNLTGVAAGDFDADDALDLVVTGEIGCSILINRGGTFEELLKESGEIPYISKPEMGGAMCCDINNDGRNDIMVWYPKMGPHFFFNRGFRCFGHAIPLDFSNSPRLEAKSLCDGLQAATVADLNSDGAEDLAVVNNEGQVFVVLRDAAEGSVLGVTAVLPLDQPCPRRIVAAEGQRSLGARLLTPGLPVLFGKAQKGPLTMKWWLPGGKEGTMTATVLRPLRIVLGPPASP